VESSTQRSAFRRFRGREYVFFGRKTKVPRHLAGCRESVSPSQQREGKNHCAKDVDWLNAARQR